MIRSDQHMHSWFSTDSTADPREMADRAIEIGLRHICFTDHCDIDFPEEGKFVVDIENYIPAMFDLAEEYRGRLEIRVGIELGLMRGTGEKTTAYASAWPFDFVIGSLHCMDGRDLFYRERYAEYSDEEYYRHYFEEYLACIRAADGFQTLGHLDYAVRYGREQEKEYSYARFADEIDAILKELIDRGIALEVNGGGLRGGLPFPNPHPDVLRRYRELGGELITVGGDGHSPAQIAYGFEFIRDILRETGFTHIAEFTGKKPVLVPLDE